MRLLLFLLLSSLYLFGDTKESVEKLLQELHKQNPPPLAAVAKNPFFVGQKPKPSIAGKKFQHTVREEEKEKKIEIQWIQGKRVLIDNVWYQEGEKFFGKELLYVGKKGIIISSGEKRRKIIKLQNSKEEDFTIGTLQ